jgi:hypothetical protein
MQFAFSHMMRKRSSSGKRVTSCCNFEHDKPFASSGRHQWTDVSRVSGRHRYMGSGTRSRREVFQIRGFNHQRETSNIAERVYDLFEQPDLHVDFETLAVFARQEGICMRFIIERSKSSTHRLCSRHIPTANRIRSEADRLMAGMSPA